MTPLPVYKPESNPSPQRLESLREEAYLQDQFVFIMSGEELRSNSQNQSDLLRIFVRQVTSILDQSRHSNDRGF